MPIPHQEMHRIIKRRIHGIEGSARIQILKALLDEIPGYYSGPYGDLRKWVYELINEAKVRRSVKHNDELLVPKDGCAQVVLVGPPNAGKSTLLRKLTKRPVAIGNYRFTTLRPAAGMISVGGALVQLVDLPGLVAGAQDGVGGGKMLLGCIRAADAIVYCLPAEAEGFLEGLIVADEVRSAGIGQVSAVLVTKADLPNACYFETEAHTAFPNLPLQTVSEGAGLQDAVQMIWTMLDLIRVWPCPQGQRADAPVVLPAGSTIKDFMNKLDRRWLERFRIARLTGPSARFPGQPVGLTHELADADEVQIQLKS